MDLIKEQDILNIEEDADDEDLMEGDEMDADEDEEENGED